jgi:hypothetical protein
VKTGIRIMCQHQYVLYPLTNGHSINDETTNMVLLRLLLTTFTLCLYYLSIPGYLPNQLQLLLWLRAHKIIVKYKEPHEIEISTTNRFPK